MFTLDGFKYFISNTSTTLFNVSQTIYDNVTYFCIGNYKGLRSLFLFINIIYDIKTIVNNKKLGDEKEINRIKEKILNCGCIGIKFTQWIIAKLKGLNNNKYDYIIKKFEDIFDNCNYHDLEYTKEIFEYDLDKKFDDIFDTDNLQSIGSGSIGQVYKTQFKKLKNKKSCNDIVVKVRHPYTDFIKFYQMLLIYFFILLQNIKWLKKKYYLHFNLNEFINNINKQVDFKIEAYNCIKLGKTYKDNEYIIIPKVHNYSKNILILSYEEGVDIETINEYDRCKAALNMLCFTYNMAIVDNFMHGDLHLKNWKVRKYKKTYQLVIYDFGICFEGPSNYYNKKAIEACETQNVRRLIELFLDDNYHNTTEREQLIDKLYYTFEGICKEPFNMVIVFNNLLYIFSSYNLVINNLFMNIMLYFCLLEDIFKKTNITCNDPNLMSIKNIIRNQKLEVITFCQTYNVYPSLKEIFEQQLHSYSDNNMDKNDLFARTKLSNIHFKNPDDISDSDEDEDETF